MKLITTAELRKAMRSILLRTGWWSQTTVRQGNRKRERLLSSPYCSYCTRPRVVAAKQSASSLVRRDCLKSIPEGKKKTKTDSLTDIKAVHFTHEETRIMFTRERQSEGMREWKEYSKHTMWGWTSCQAGYLTLDQCFPHAKEKMSGQSAWNCPLAVALFPMFRFLLPLYTEYLPSTEINPVVTI